MSIGWNLLAAAMLMEKIWKHALVERFFRRPTPSASSEPALVSIIQPILSGDPTLRHCLEDNLRMTSRYRSEYIWVIDSDDDAAQHLCQLLIDTYPQHSILLLVIPPPDRRDNPKMIKLIAGVERAHGDVICVLDDDTSLPNGGLEQALPFLQQPNVGLAFGLPYYRSFDNIWSSLLALFVNDNSLLTYIPYTALTNPFTINGMFYALRRDVLDHIGGFDGLQHILADDFAVAARVRAHGYHLVQTPLCHPISTFVPGPSHYWRVIQRWFIFPRESLLRYLTWREQLLLYSLAFVPTFFPVFLLLACFRRPTKLRLSYTLLYLIYSLTTYQRFNQGHLRNATPRRYLILLPLVKLLVPFQLLIALCSPQQIVWRGHLLEVERGGGFHFVRRRTEGQGQ